MNNFDTSITGISVDVTIGLDEIMAQDNFEENFLEIKKGDLKGKFIYTSYGELIQTAKEQNLDLTNLEPEFVIEENKEVNKTIIENYSDYYYFQENSSTQDLFDTITDYIDYNDKIEFCNNLKLNYSLKHDFSIISTRGYCQGDYHEVLIFTDLLRKCYGVEDSVKQEDLVSNQDIDNLFWDQPMTARATVNDMEYYSERFDGQYQGWIEIDGINVYDGFNKDLFIKEIISKVLQDFPGMNKELLKEQLEEVTPSEIN